MNGKAHPARRITAAFAIVASLFVIAAQSAAAFDGRSPDTRSAAVVNVTGGGSLGDVRSPDTQTAAQIVRLAASASPVADLRSPDTRERVSTSATTATHAATGSTRGFSWSEFGMGAGATAGALLLLAVLAAGAVAMSRQRRDRPSTV